LRDEHYARWLVEDPARFRDEALDTHGRTTRAVTAAGRLQLPWPRALGTPPWAVAHELTAVTGRRWVVRAALPRAAALAALAGAVREGTPCPLYVGSRWLPRHVVLVVEVPVDGASLRCYEPHSGRVLTVTRTSFLDATFRLAGWTTPWWVVVPETSVVNGK